MTTDNLTIYAIQRRIDGHQISEFDHVIDPDRLDSVDDTRDFESPPHHDPAWSARMYLWKGVSKPPPWVKFLEEGFGDEPIDVTGSAQDCAVVVVKAYFRVERLYAIPLGLSGRFQIRHDVIDRRYGLRVALNLLYEGDTAADELAAAHRIRQVESKTIGANTMRTIRHANRHADFEDFDLNPDIDQLAGIAGQPRDTALARRVRGTDGLRVGRRTSFDQLGDLCRSVARAYQRDDYQRRFRFVDQFQGINDPNMIDSLTKELGQSLCADPAAWTFSVPGVLDYDQLAAVRVTTPSSVVEEFSDPTVGDIMDTVGADDVMRDLSKIQVETINSDGNVMDRWSMFDCLDGQIVDSGDTYLLEAGTYYQIEPDYLVQLNQDIDAIPNSSVVLPPSRREMNNGKLKEIEEDAYNAQASEPANHFLLDKKTIVIPGKTSPIEVCDILTQDRQLVHVKRKFSSSALSHLFSQGFVSAELLVDSEAFRAKIREKIGGTSPRFQELFPDARIVAADWEVVYAVIGPWNDEAPSVKLPFFSKVNLREFKRRLRVMGFEVTLVRVPVIDP